VSGLGIAETFPLRDFVREEMEARDWDIDELALRMGPREEFGINRLVLGFLLEMEPQKGLLIGVGGSKALARAFGTSDEFWLNLDRQWQPEEYARFEARRANTPDRSLYEAGR